jgi:hypothetical protein|tara:strand:+ start:7526 stop:8713 length:1188 start_codon:yes stop_codon:yes gene_type:complete
MNPAFKFFSSIRLTVYLLFASTLLIFVGTLDQVQDGIYLAQKRYYEHVFVIFTRGRFQLPIPGGYLIGPLLILNLLAAHFRYYRMGWRKLGIAALHLGVIALLVGQLITQTSQKDSFMWLSEGERKNYLESFHEDELVVIDRSDDAVNRIVSWPVAAFESGDALLQHPMLPFQLKIKAYALNAGIGPIDALASGAIGGFDRGLASRRNFGMTKLPPTYADGERNRMTAAVEVIGADGSLGQWMVSNIFRQAQPVRVPTSPQTFVYQNREYEIALRFKRAYLPSQIELLDFKHDRYPGTEIPFNFSSKVNIIGETSGDERSTLIYMNHPLRYAGYTFFQASFAENDTMSMFQVVKNPGRLIPYVACAIISIGLLYQFGFSLIVFALKSRERRTQTS